jgi:hypothetical protein
LGHRLQLHHCVFFGDDDVINDFKQELYVMLFKELCCAFRLILILLYIGLLCEHYLPSFLQQVQNHYL